MFWKKKVSKDDLLAADKAADIELGDDLKSQIQMLEITVALSRSTTEYSFGQSDHRDDFKNETSIANKFFGVVHIDSERKKYIPARIVFTRGRESSSSIGSLLLYRRDNLSDIYSRLRLEVTLDYDEFLCESIKKTIRDGNQSNIRFVHLYIRLFEVEDKIIMENYKKIIDGNKDIQLMWPIRSVCFVDDLTLAKSPVWSWKWFEI